MENNVKSEFDLYPAMCKWLKVHLEDKYKMFLDELKKDDMVFDGKNKQVLRKYALKLKNTLKPPPTHNSQKKKLKNTSLHLLQLEMQTQM